MKLKTDLSEHAFTLSSLALFAGLACGHAKPAPEASVTQAPPAPVAAANTDAVKAPPTPAEAFHAQGQADLDKALQALQHVSVFFEYDSATLTKDAEEKLTAVGNILAQHPELKVRIEGNCDERGSEQYNIALGQRRADAGKRYLDKLGVKAEQITAISFGDQKPKAEGHDEAAWKQNRRDDVAAQPQK